MTRWGLIGASTIAHEWVIDAIRATGGEVVSVMSSSAERAKDYAAANGIAKSHDRSRRRCSATDIDAVYISTTNELHRDQTIAAAQRRQACAVRKAAGAVAWRCPRHGRRPARDAGVVMGTNHHLRNAGTHRAMRDAIAAGRIGKPLVGPRLPRRSTCRRTCRAGASTGRRPAAASSSISPCTMPTRCASCSATIRSRPSPRRSRAAWRKAGLEDAVMGVLRFKSGLIAQFHDGFTTQIRRHRLRGAWHRRLADRPRLS